VVPFYFSGFIVKHDFAWENDIFGFLSKKHGIDTKEKMRKKQEKTIRNKNNLFLFYFYCNFLQ